MTEEEFPFTVRNWDTDEILSGHKTLAIAKRYCRGEGHTGRQSGIWFAPVAYVANQNGECVYNPRFSSVLSSEVGTVVATFDDHLRGG